MKKILFILPVILMPLLNSCEVEEGESQYPQTMQGKIAYDAVEARLYQAISYLELAAKVDYYAQAPAGEKEAIKNHYLQPYTLTQTANTWKLTNDLHDITLTHNGKPINEPGSAWTIRIIGQTWSGERSTVISDKNFQIETLADKDWKITTDSLPLLSLASSFSFTMDNRSSGTFSIKGNKAYDKAPNLYDYVVNSGYGKIDLFDTKIAYYAIEPITYLIPSNYTELMPVSGKLAITAGQSNIQAEIAVPGSYLQLFITMDGVTENW